MRYKMLIKVDPIQNNNRVFVMAQDTGGTFQTETGRYGVKLTKYRRYPMKLWDSVYEKHIEDGYVDRTEETTGATLEKTAKYQPIPDLVVNELIQFLQKCANHRIQESYSIQVDEVSPKAIEKAQEMVHRLGSVTNTDVFNSTLLELFVVLPRKMKDVNALLARSEREFADIIEREQELLDVMAFEVNRRHKPIHTNRPTILDELGLEARLCTDEELKQIKKHMGKESSGLCMRAFRVINKITQKKFDAYCQTHKISEEDWHYFYHGSKNANYLGILSQGLLLNPNAPITGKMFGHGIYFANRAKKSINYTDLRGSIWAHGHSEKAYLAVFKVAYKNPKHIQYWNHSMSGYNKHAIQPYDALFAHKGGDLVNDEIIIYDEAQATIQYLIELGC